LGLPDAAVERVLVDLHKEAERVARWQWRPKPSLLEMARERQYAFRLGQDAPPFVYHGIRRGATTIDKVEVFVQITPGQRTYFSIGVAYVPADETGGSPAY
jgi:hypothetical protein